MDYLSKISNDLHQTRTEFVKIIDFHNFFMGWVLLDK